MTGYALLDDLPEALHVELADRRPRQAAHRPRRTRSRHRPHTRTRARQPNPLPGPLMLDLRALSFIDATGLAGPLGAATDARRHRYTLKLAPATPSPDCSNCARSTRASATPTHRPADPPADDLLRLNHAETSPRPARIQQRRPHPTRPAARGDGRAPTLTSPTAMR